MIPKSHPRFISLQTREKLVNAFDSGLVAMEGLIAQGRGEALDYLVGEKTSKSARKAISAAAYTLQNAKNPVISVNGNFAALCAPEIIKLSRILGAKIEINLFYGPKNRKKKIAKFLKKSGAKEILGINSKSAKKLNGIDSDRRVVDRDGIYSADVVLVPLEDGDRTIALKKARKKGITFDLNPLSRTAQTADITIVDNVTRAMKLLIIDCKKKKAKSRYNNKKVLSKSISEIRKNLKWRAQFA